MNTITANAFYCAYVVTNDAYCKTVNSGGSKNFEKGVEDNLSARPHLSQIHTTIYMPFTRKNTAFLEKNFEPIGGGRPHGPPLNPPLTVNRIGRKRRQCKNALPASSPFSFPPLSFLLTSSPIPFHPIFLPLLFVAPSFLFPSPKSSLRVWGKIYRMAPSLGTERHLPRYASPWLRP